VVLLRTIRRNRRRERGARRRGREGSSEGHGDLNPRGVGLRVLVFAGANLAGPRGARPLLEGEAPPPASLDVRPSCFAFSVLVLTIPLLFIHSTLSLSRPGAGSRAVGVSLPLDSTRPAKSRLSASFRGRRRQLVRGTVETSSLSGRREAKGCTRE
jgi:hypothetical protein